MLCNVIGSAEIPVEFTQSGPKSLDLPPPCVRIMKVITCWGVAKVELTRLCTLAVNYANPPLPTPLPTLLPTPLPAHLPTPLPTPLHHRIRIIGMMMTSL